MTAFDGLIVFVGGRSARMGSSKALLRYQGQAQLVRLLVELAELSPRVVLSCRQEQRAELLHLLQAEAPGNLVQPERLAWAYDGPGTETPFQALADITAGLVGQRLLVLGVDQPLLEARACLELALAGGASPIACFRGAEGELEPFPSIWDLRPELRAALLAARDRGHFGFRRFFAEQGARASTPSEPRWLLNVNTLEEAQAAEAFLRSHSSRNANIRSRFS